MSSSGLSRPTHPMSPEVEQALTEQDLWEDYHARPAYQQNDYMWWINSAKRPETREKRLAQMLEELRKGGIYMNMKHPASVKDEE